MLSNAIEAIIPTDFLVMTSGSYQPQHLHSWNLSGNVQQVNTLTRHIATNASVAVTPDLISNATHGIMTVDVDHQGVVPIVEGWNNNRGVFILKFIVKYKAGVAFDWIVQGYTDYPAYTSNNIDPNMVFYINNVFAMARTTAQYGNHAINRASMMNEYQVLNGFDAGNGRPGGNLLMRPRDIFSNISTADFMGSAKVVDATMLANFSVQTSRHTNNIAGSMLADSLNVWHSASCDVDSVQGNGAIADRAYSNVLETESEQDVFMSLLSSHNNGTTSSSFSGAQLLRAVDGIMQVYKPIANSSQSGVRWSTTRDSAVTGGTSMEHHIAINVQAMLPSIMVDSMLAGVAFTVDNDSGQVLWTRSNVSAFVPEMAEGQWLVFRRRVEREIMPFFTRFGMRFSLIVSCSFFGEIKINIRINDHVEFVSPAFCNSLFSPVQTTSTLRTQEFAQSFEFLAGQVNEALMESGIRRASSTNQAIEKFAVAAPSREFRAPAPLNISPAVNAGSMTAGMHAAHAYPGQPTAHNPAPSAGGMMAGLGGAAPAVHHAQPAAPAQGGMTSGLRR